MKKFLFALVVAALVLCCFACAGRQPKNQKQKSEKSVVVSYYDGDLLVKTEEYKGEIDLYDYQKEGYEFKGWYVDEDLTLSYDPEDPDFIGRESFMLYAKTEKIMNDFEIEIVGKIGEDGYVVNPLFTWKNTNEDVSYKVAVTKNGANVKSDTVRGLSYQAGKTLKPNTEYEFSVTGKTSKAVSTVRFKTADVTDGEVKSITVAQPFMDNMVIQRDVPIDFVGVGPANQLISVSLGGEKTYTLSDREGNFAFTLPAREASFEEVTVRFSNGAGVTQDIKHVLFGDVYFFAGQSNMQWYTKDSDCEESDLKKLSGTRVRFFTQSPDTSSTKSEVVTNGRWFIPDEYNVGGYSAIITMTGSFLGEALREETPIGILSAYQGDTNISEWMDGSYYTGNFTKVSGRYNRMVYPLRRQKIKGVVWYQGCNNAALGCEYKDHLTGLFRNYRDLFANDELSFFVVGLACFDGDDGNNFDFSFVRESQAKACAADSHAYFISACDEGNGTKQLIHPETKRYICLRLAKSIGAVFYGRDCYAEGPTYKGHTVDGNVVTISFENAKGLKSIGAITGLYLAGEDGKYHLATASVVGETIVASCDKVASPRYVKYGFAKSPYVNVFNKDDFAIVPFRTDEYGLNVDLFDYDSVEVYTQHPSGDQMTCTLTSGNLTVSKQSGSAGFGSVQLAKWGAIAYKPEAFALTFVGTGSGAEIMIRASEDNYETWGYRVVDDVAGKRTVTIDFDEFTVMDATGDSRFETQRIRFVEIVIKADGAASVEICGAKFVKKQ